jgi:CHAT domain-containing protein
MQERLRRDALVLVVADGPLHALSFAALWDGHEYFVERGELWTVPSVTLFRWANNQLGITIPQSTTVATIGDPAFASGRFPRLSRLAGAEREAADVGRLYAHATILTGARAVKGRVLSAMAAADIIHVAAHAVANSVAPEESYILVADGGLPNADLITAREIAQLPKLSARLIALSACQTGSGRVARGEGVLSLARVFMAAGVPMVVATLWDISDADGYTLFVAFHRELARGQTAAAALRAAQLASLRSENAEQRRPRNWAAAVGIGANQSLR